jgi:hypothetical protein
MLLFLFVCLILSQRFFIRFYPEWLKKKLLKAIALRSMYFMKLKNKGHIILHNRSADQTSAAVNYSSEDPKHGY